METFNKVSWKKGINIFVFILGLSVCIFTILTADWIIDLDGDNAPLTYALYSTVGKCLHNGELPLWNSYIWGGFSNIGAMVTQAFYPINWILCFLFYNTETEVLSYSIIPANIIVHVVIFYIGMYLLLRKLKTDSMSASIICTLSVMSFSLTKFLTWIVYLDGFSWFPFIVLVAINMFEDKKSGMICLALLFAVEALLSVSQMLIIIVFFLAALLVLYMYKNKDWWKILIKMAVSGILAICLSAPVIFQSLDYMQTTKRFLPGTGWISTSETVPISEYTLHQCNLDDLKAFVSFMPKYSWCSIGGIFLILIIIGLVSKPENKKMHVWSVAGLSYVLFYAMGFIFPEIIYYIPLLNVMREPFMYAIFISFFGGLVAANGLRNIRLCIQNNEKFSSYISGSKFILVILSILVVYNILPHNELTWKRVVYVLMIAAFVYALFMTPLKKGNKIIIATTLLCSVAGELYLFYYMMDSVGRFDEISAIAQIEKVNSNNIQELEQLEQYKEFAGITSWGIGCLPANQQGLFGVRDVQGYFNPVQSNAIFVHNNINLEKRSQLQDINYFLINEENNEELLGWFDSYDIFKMEKKLQLNTLFSSNEKDDVRAYQVKNSLGTGWCVGTWKMQGDMTEEQIAEWINCSDTDLSKVALVNTNALSATTMDKLNLIDRETATADVKLMERKNNRMQFSVNAPEEMIFVCASLYSSGWKVFVNNKKVDLLQVDYTNLGAIIPKGESIIEFVYCPISVTVGYGLQILAAIALVTIALKKRSKYNRRG